MVHELPVAVTINKSSKTKNTGYHSSENSYECPPEQCFIFCGSVWLSYTEYSGSNTAFHHLRIKFIKKLIVWINRFFMKCYAYQPVWLTENFIMTTRITFSMTSDETLRIVDEYCHTHKLSRSKVINALLSATAPVLNDINGYYQLAGELQSRWAGPLKYQTVDVS